MIVFFEEEGIQLLIKAPHGGHSVSENHEAPAWPVNLPLPMDGDLIWFSSNCFLYTTASDQL